MRILVLGAGVIGSFNAARLQQGGHEVELLARGRRLDDLRHHGVVLEEFRTGHRSAVLVPLIDRIDPRTGYDVVLVVVRRNQVASVLPMLATHQRTPTCLFLGNNASGPDDMIRSLGRERVVTGMVNAGGEREGHVVRLRRIWIQQFYRDVDNTTGQQEVRRREDTPDGEGLPPGRDRLISPGLGGVVQ